MKYSVEVMRHESCFVEVEADCEEEAQDLAYDEAIDLAPQSQVWETYDIECVATLLDTENE